MRRREIIGIEVSNGTDYGCKTYAYKDKKGILHVEKTELWPIKQYGLKPDFAVFDELHNYKQ